MSPTKKDIASQQPTPVPNAEKLTIKFGNQIIQRPTSNTSTRRMEKEDKA